MGSREGCFPSRPTETPWCPATHRESHRFPKGPTAIAGQAIGWRKSSSPSRPGPGGIRFDLPQGCEVPLEVWDFAPARPALVRPADERLRAARRAGDRLLPPGPRASELPELPAVLVAGRGCRRLRPEDGCRTDRGTGRLGTAASGRFWTAPPSPICPAGGCRSTSSTSR